MQTVLFPGDLQVCGFAAYEGLICKFASYEEILYKVEEFKCLESMLLESEFLESNTAYELEWLKHIPTKS